MIIVKPVFIEDETRSNQANCKGSAVNNYSLWEPKGSSIDDHSFCTYYINCHTLVQSLLAHETSQPDPHYSLLFVKAIVNSHCRVFNQCLDHYLTNLCKPADARSSYVPVLAQNLHADTIVDDSQPLAPHLSHHSLHASTSFFFNFAFIFCY